MPRTKEQNETLKSATKQKIHAAATRLFTQKGFAATSVQDIAERAGISTGLMYRHYPTKQSLYGALVLEAADGLEEVTRRLQQDASPREVLDGLTQEILDDIGAGDEFARFMILIMQAFMTQETIREVQFLMDCREKLIETTANLIRRGQGLGQIRPGNAAEMAQFYYAVIQGLAETKSALQDRFQPPHIDLIRAFLFEEDAHDD